MSFRSPEDARAFARSLATERLNGWRRWVDGHFAEGIERLERFQGDRLSWSEYGVTQLREMKAKRAELAAAGWPRSVCLSALREFFLHTTWPK